MELKIGELAKRCGLSIRTLHHYDAIGLLPPSIRTAGGARIYGRQDFLRLHRIQVLKQIGYSLLDIQSALDSSVDPVEIIGRQARLLAAQSKRARELSDRLDHLSGRLTAGDAAESLDWLSLLEMMTIHERHLTESEIRILRSPTCGTVQEIENQRSLLVSEVRDCMRRRMPVDGPQARSLAWRWVHMVIASTGNNAALAGKLKTLQERESRAQEINGIDASMLAWIGQAIVHARLFLFARYMSPEQASAVRNRQLTHAGEWPPLIALVREQMERGTPASAAPMRSLAARWQALFRDSYTGGDAALETAVRHAMAEEPDLSLGFGVDDDLMRYVRAALTAASEITGAGLTQPSETESAISARRQFDFLTGDWDVDATKYAADGSTLFQYKARWTATCLNEGQMVMDDFQALAPDGRPISSYVTLRTYCEATRRWEMAGLAALQPVSNAAWHGHWAGDEMRLVAEGLDPAGQRVKTRIRFGDITPESFLWSSESSSDDGATWTRAASLVAKRRI